MNPCRRMEEKLIAQEPLTAEEGTHLGACAACRELAAAEQAIREAGRELAGYGQASDAELDRLQQRLGASRPRAYPRLALAVSALAACLVISFVAFGPQRTDPAEPQVDLMALLDEVEAITSDTAASEQWATPVMGLDYDWPDDAVIAESDLPLPAGYQLLDENL